MSKRILFVDDDPAPLQSPERIAQSLQSEWNIEFAVNSNAALEALSRETFDAVVTRMKGEGGETVFLEQLKQRHPQTLRFALLEARDRAAMLQAVTAAHHSLAKPWDAAALRNELRRAFALQDALRNKSVRDVIRRVDRLPSAPTVYTRLVEATGSPACNISMVSDIVQQDMAIAAKLLQLANSPLFGFRFQVSNVAHAVSLLGMGTVKSLALSVGVFSQFQGGGDQESEALALWEHSVVASRMARRIAELIELDRKGAEDAFTAGLVHEIGRLLLIVELPKEWAEVKRIADTEKLPLSDAEWKVLSCTRDEIGAYLLETWNLPTAIVEAVAWRARPSLSLIRKPGPLAALHIADCACARIFPSYREHPEFDSDFLGVCRLDSRDDEFVAACEAVVKKEGE